MRTTGLEVVHPHAGRGGGNNGRRHGVADALVSLLVRGLGLERAALFFEEAPGRAFVPVATHGAIAFERIEPDEAPGDGPWSAVLPVSIGERPSGLLLLARDGGRPLEAGDYTLAAGVATAAWNAIGFGGIAADTVRTRDRLERTDRMAALGMLAASVAHEIRNPMVSVRTFIQLLPERMQDEEFCTSYRDLALGESDRICTLLNDLLSFSRPASPDISGCDLSDASAQVIRLLEVEARNRDVTLRPALDDSVPPVALDDDHVKQILMNLVVNALDACSPGGEVVVATRAVADANGGRCAIDVADTGAGIPASELERIFDPFYTTKDTGSGLGLFIARRIVQQHQGTIAACAREGGGTVFTIELPAVGKDGHGGPAG